MLELLDVSDAARDGFTQMRIPLVCVSARGTVLCGCEARRTRSDWGEIDLLLRRSTDGGRTFSPSQNVARFDGEIERDPSIAQHAADAGRTFNNMVLVSAKSGALHLLFCVEYRRVIYRRSDDDGQTWSEPRDITPAFEPLRDAYPWRVVATGPNHGIELGGGRLLVPVWLSRGSDGPGGDHRPSIVASLYSDDAGQSWHCGEIVAREDDPLHNPSETVAAQLPDGRVVFNIRSESAEHRRALSYSPDGATQWTRPVFHPDLFEAVCAAGLTRAGEDLVFSSPNPPQDAARSFGGLYVARENLMVRLSRDGGQTWPVSRVLDAGAAGYSDLNALADGTLLCFYERASGHETQGEMRVCTLARFDRAWLESR